MSIDPRLIALEKEVFDLVTLQPFKMDELRDMIDRVREKMSLVPIKIAYPRIGVVILHVCENCGIVIGIEGEYSNRDGCINCGSRNKNPIKGEFKEEDRERIKKAFDLE